MKRSKTAGYGLLVLALTILGLTLTNTQARAQQSGLAPTPPMAVE